MSCTKLLLGLNKALCSAEWTEWDDKSKKRWTFSVSLFSRNEFQEKFWENLHGQAYQKLLHWLAHIFKGVSKQLHKGKEQQIVLRGQGVGVSWLLVVATHSYEFGQPLWTKVAQLSNFCAAALLWTCFTWSPQHPFINNYREVTKTRVFFCRLSSIWCYTSFPSCLCAELSV